MKFGMIIDVDFDNPIYLLPVIDSHEQIDIIEFKLLSVYKEYYYTHILKWSKKKEKWVYEK